MNAVDDASGVKAILEAMSIQQLDSLKQTAIYYRLVSVLRYLALSALAMCLCSWIFYFNFFTVFHVIVNVAMVGVCLWAIAKPSSNVGLALGFALLLCGSWNLFVTFYIGLAVFNIILAGIGILQIMYAVQAYRAYQRYSLSLFVLPDKPIRQHYEAIWKSIIKPLPADQGDILPLEINTNQYWWQGLYKQNQVKSISMLLLPNQAVMAYKHRKWLEFVPKAEAIIEMGAGYKFSVSEPLPVGMPLNNNGGKKLTILNVLIRLSNEVFSGYIHPNTLQTYINWKQISDPQSLMSDLFADERQVQTRISKAILISFGLYLLVGAVLVILAMQNPQW